MRDQDSHSGEQKSLPCLYSHIGIENPQKVYTNDIQDTSPVFTTGRKRSAFVLSQSVEKMAKQYGLGRLGFLTLTFRDHVLCPKEAQARLKSLTTNVIKLRYQDYLGVFERQKSGRIHYHLLVALNEDIRTGVDFDALMKKDYKSAGKYLRDEWAFWRKTAPKYRFGRTELLPIKGRIDAIKYYVGKYISKSVKASENDQDKGVRLVRYSKSSRAGNTRFSFLTDHSRSWRKALKLFAELLSDYFEESISEMSDLKRKLGPRWAFHSRDYILDISDVIQFFESIHFPIETENKGIIPPFDPETWKQIKSQFYVGPFLRSINRHRYSKPLSNKKVLKEMEGTPLGGSHFFNTQPTP